MDPQLCAFLSQMCQLQQNDHAWFEFTNRQKFAPGGSKNLALVLIYDCIAMELFR